MTIVWIILGSTILCALMAFIGHFVKDKKSVFATIGTLSVIAIFVAALIFFYGTSLLQSLKLSLNSVEDLKNFLGSRFVGFIAMIVAYIFLLFDISLTVKFSVGKKAELKDYLFFVTFIVFDIAVIPNILISELGLYVYLGVNLTLIGLACLKLVFSIIYRPKLFKLEVVR